MRQQAVQVGDPAPDFELQSQLGESIRLSDYRGKQNVVLFFYPKDETPGCTREVCAFRDAYEIFQKAGAEVLGVSSDSIESHSQFAPRYHLPFLLLADPGGVVRRRYGVPTTLGLLPGRVTYVIDRDGIIRHIFSSQLKVQGHVDEALLALDQLNLRAI